ncbi:hypothetical protein PTI98_010936 [Pleurotus ostreatus]|nr:hypothetical protein PTI98_010936 [Pleurotus ostreatus]
MEAAHSHHCITIEERIRRSNFHVQDALLGALMEFVPEDTFRALSMDKVIRVHHWPRRYDNAFVFTSIRQVRSFLLAAEAFHTAWGRLATPFKAVYCLELDPIFLLPQLLRMSATRIQAILQYLHLEELNARVSVQWEADVKCEAGDERDHVDYLIPLLRLRGSFQSLRHLRIKVDAYENPEEEPLDRIWLDEDCQWLLGCRDTFPALEVFSFQTPYFILDDSREPFEGNHNDDPQKIHALWKHWAPFLPDLAKTYIHFAYTEVCNRFGTFSAGNQFLLTHDQNEHESSKITMVEGPEDADCDPFINYNGEGFHVEQRPAATINPIYLLIRPFDFA